MKNYRYLEVRKEKEIVARISVDGLLMSNIKLKKKELEKKHGKTCSVVSISSGEKLMEIY